ncbi:NUDIX domain-containing protein [Candidatus Woesearchaeota archaeon]|nr:NUDIX domain-containing protein [Candidatus Woesearchaeota archaeon]
MGIERFWVVDDTDRPLMTANWDTIHNKHAPLRHRAVAVLMYKTPEKQELLISRRGEKVKYGQGKWQASAAGHVSHPFTYPEAAKAETLEELFYNNVLPDIKFDWVGRVIHSSRTENLEIVGVFEVVYNGSVFLNHDESAEVRWKQYSELNAEIIDAQPCANMYTKTFVNVMLAYSRWRDGDNKAILPPFSEPVLDDKPPLTF